MWKIVVPAKASVLYIYIDDGQVAWSTKGPYNFSTWQVGLESINGYTFISNKIHRKNISSKKNIDNINLITCLPKKIN